LRDDSGLGGADDGLIQRREKHRQHQSGHRADQLWMGQSNDARRVIVDLILADHHAILSGDLKKTVRVRFSVEQAASMSTL
jgi:hypothetical protein